MIMKSIEHIRVARVEMLAHENHMSLHHVMRGSLDKYMIICSLSSFYGKVELSDKLGMLKALKLGIVLREVFQLIDGDSKLVLR